jgi:pimeloyl-ACP methyl ester carboxylesterase
MSRDFTYTVCFNGTGCPRDEGEFTHNNHSDLQKGNKGSYHPETGYIPNRMHIEINENIKGGYTPGSAEILQNRGTADINTDKSASVRGVGMADFYLDENVDGGQPKSYPLKRDVLSYGDGDPDNIMRYLDAYFQNHHTGESRIELLAGWSMSALALHGANLAAAAITRPENKATKIVFIGHSRGGCECMMAANFLYWYGTDQMKAIPVYIFAIDPVPGFGDWYHSFTQLTPNVKKYVGVYAFDHMAAGFSAVVPRPTKAMYNGGTEPTPLPTKITQEIFQTQEEFEAFFDDTFFTGIGKDYHTDDPISKDTSNSLGALQDYDLYICRGMHGTVTGNMTTDSGTDPSKANADDVGAVPKLVYKMARGYLAEWGVQFATTEPLVTETVAELRARIEGSTATALFDEMGGGAERTPRTRFYRFYCRECASDGSKLYIEDVIGPVPKGQGDAKLPYPITTEADKSNARWAKWKFL